MTRTFRSLPTLLIVFFCISIASCTKNEDLKKANDRVQANIKKYEAVWDGIINKGDLTLFNETNFSSNVVFHMKPADAVGIPAARDYYANYLTGFSNIKFSFETIFGEGDQLTKHWKFEGTHTGDFFGIPPTGKFVSVEGSTIARMIDGKIVEEQDFFDNLDLLTQLGLYP